MQAGSDLLASLRESDLHSIRNDLESAPLTLKQCLHEPDRLIQHVYFPTNGVVSLVNEPEPDHIVEFATIGREGFVGVPVLLDSEAMPSRAIVQIPGEALRMSASRFKKTVDERPEFRSAMMRCTLALLTQIAQSTTCNRLHEIQERCARWLLQTHDRVNGDTFPLTQEFLAQMLGVHRPTVTIAAGMLQRAGLIQYSRGSITVLDRKGLEAASCECYGIITREYDRLLNAPNRRRPRTSPTTRITEYGS